MGKVNVITIVSGEIANNTYIVYGESSKSAVVVDPSGNGMETVDKLEELGLTCELILLTHGHHDHISGVETVSNRYGCPVAVHELDAPMMRDPAENMSAGHSKRISCDADRLLKDGHTVEAAGLSFKVMHTPGHTLGGVCYVCQDVIFTGDTLFYRSCGRTDFKGGSLKDMESSFARLYSLEGDYKCYPGHDMATTLEEERRSNYYFRAD